MVSRLRKKLYKQLMLEELQEQLEELMKQYRKYRAPTFPERDVYFDSPKYITLVRRRDKDDEEGNTGYEITGVGIGIKGKQYASDPREIIPAYGMQLHPNAVIGHVHESECDFKIHPPEDLDSEVMRHKMVSIQEQMLRLELS